MYEKQQLLQTHPLDLSSSQLDRVQRLINEDEEFAKAWRNATNYNRTPQMRDSRSVIRENEFMSAPQSALNFYKSGSGF